MLNFEIFHEFFSHVTHDIIFPRKNFWLVFVAITNKGDGLILAFMKKQEYDGCLPKK